MSFLLFFFVHHRLFRPGQTERIDQIAGGSQDSILGEQSVSLGIHQVGTSLDCFGFCVENIEQCSFANVELLGVGGGC